MVRHGVTYHNDLLWCVQTTCCMAVLPFFKELAKYNLRQLTLPPEEPKEGVEEPNGPSV